MKRFPSWIGGFKLLGGLGNEPIRERIMKCLNEHDLELKGLADELLRRKLEIPVIEYGYHDLGTIRVIMRGENLNRDKTVWLDFEATTGQEVEGFDSLQLSKVMESDVEARALTKAVINTVIEYDKDNLLADMVTKEQVGQYW